MLKTKETSALTTDYETSFACITSTIDFLRFKIGIPLPEILKVLTDATAVLGFEMGERAGVEAAIQMVRGRIQLVEDTHRSLDANAGKFNR